MSNLYTKLNDIAKHLFACPFGKSWIGTDLNRFILTGWRLRSEGSISSKMLWKLGGVLGEVSNLICGVKLKT